MFQDFKIAVLKAYSKKKDSMQLSENLLSPTRAKLRSECLLILKNRYQKKDEEAIKAFFDPHGKFENLELSIRKFELDGFTALKNFLQKQSDIRREETVKLLAWLIDFEPRPYQFEIDYPSVPSEKKTDTGSESPMKKEDQKLPEGKSNSSPKASFNFRIAKKIWPIAAILLISAFVFTFYEFRGEPANKEITADKNFDRQQNMILTTFEDQKGKSQSSVRPIKSTKKCMYWRVDHYIAIPCDLNLGDTAKYVLDPEKVEHFKKIMTPDTLSNWSVGKVYYFKKDGKLEYFTSEGFHPIYRDRKLKKLSNYMLNKYVIASL